MGILKSGDLAWIRPRESGSCVILWVPNSLQSLVLYNRPLLACVVTPFGCVVDDLTMFLVLSELGLHEVDDRSLEKVG